jgi:plasmid stability protein
MKMFTLRKIPVKLHLAWKIAAAKQGISMEDLAIKILESGLLESEEHDDKKGTKRRK